MHAAKSVEDLFAAFRIIGLPDKDIRQLERFSDKMRSQADFCLEVAALLRPQHVFDATYYHCVDTLYRYALTRFESTCPGWGNYGVLLQEWGRYGEAIQCHRRALQLDQTYSRALANLGFCYEQAGEWQEAQEAYERYERGCGASAQSRTGLGNCELSLENPLAAVDCYMKALDADPLYRDARFMLSVALARLGRWEAGLRYATSLLAECPKDEGTQELVRCLGERTAYETVDAPRRPFDRLSERMQNLWNYPGDIRKDGPWRWVSSGICASAQAKADPSKVFISYRWGNADEDKGVERFANELSMRGYRVILDRFAPPGTTSGSPYASIVQQLANTSLFVPILTEGYRRRVEMVGDMETSIRTGVILDAGRVFDEWSVALLLAARLRLRMLGVWHSGAVVPVPFTPETVCDLRTSANLDAAFPRLSWGKALVVGAGYDDFGADRDGNSNLQTLPSDWPCDSLMAFARLRVPELQKRIVTSTHGDPQ